MRIAVTLLVALVLAATTGCTPEQPPILPAPAPSSTPLFASEEEALAAAEEAYGRYLAVSDLIISEGGAEPERLLEVATEEVFERERIGFESVAQRELRSVGSTYIERVSIQSFATEHDSLTPDVTVYACVNVSNVDLINSMGESVVGEERPDVYPVEASFQYRPGPGGSLLMSHVETWEGFDFCAE